MKSKILIYDKTISIAISYDCFQNFIKNYYTKNEENIFIRINTILTYPTLESRVV